MECRGVFKVLVVAMAVSLPFCSMVDGAEGRTHDQLVSNPSRSYRDEEVFSKRFLRDTRQLRDNSSSHLARNNSCPVWFKVNTNNPHDCICTDKLQSILQCDNKTMKVKLSIGYCMSYIEETGGVFVGLCPYNFFHIGLSTLSVPLPQNSSKVEEFICGNLNREGLFCGRCKPGFGLSPSPNHYRCSNCSEDGHNWGRYLATDFLLQTVFILILFIFKISVTSPALGVYILFCQILSITNGFILVEQILEAHNLTDLNRLAAATFALYSVWKLDFFTLLIPRQCLNEQLEPLSAIGLQYIISAFYPLTLIILLYICIKLHDSKYKIFVWIYKPFHWCRVKVKKYYEFEQPVAHAFATVFLLSFMKVLDVSHLLLAPTQLYNESGDAVQPLAWYYDASVKFFKRAHIFWVLLALFVFCVYILFPTLLIFLYPFKWFQKCLNKIHLGRSWLSIFMDILQSPYKNGLNGTADLRSFAGVYFWVRILFVLIRFSIGSHSWHYNILSMLFIILGVIVATLKPYKKRIYNIIDCVFLCLLATEFNIYFLLTVYSALSNMFSLPLFIILVILGILPIVYFVAYLLYHLFRAAKVPKKWKTSARRKWSDFKNIFSSAGRRENSRVNNLVNVDDFELPHRYLRPDLYNELLPEDKSDS